MDITSRHRVSVVLPVSLDASYDYLVPDSLALNVGSFVVVPFGNQERIGVVWDQPDENAGTLDVAKLKTVLNVLDVPPLAAVSMRFAEWVARYTLTPRGMVLRLMMGAPQAFEPEKPRWGVMLSGPPPTRLTDGRRRVLEAAGDGFIRSKTALAAEAAVGVGVVDGLVRSGTLVQVEMPAIKFSRPRTNFIEPDFQGDQVAAVQALRSAIDACRYNVSLLDGVTGSGKTEVYFEAVARALDCGRQILILLPEIALTGQFVARFEERFGVAPVEWHSGVNTNVRGRAWRGVATGEACVVVGARSALFLPFRDLGLIVVDEEHDGSYKQEDRVIYQCRDMAVVRASLGQAAVVLASATPSIESHVNARTGRYRHILLRERYSTAELPEIEAIDLKATPPERGRWLSPPLVSALKETYEKGQQSLLFLNRRGYAPLTLCRSCGHRIECPRCSAWLVEHRFRGRLNCHHCGFSTPMPQHCPKCGKEEALVACGPGVERIAEEVREVFPDMRLALMSSDLITGVRAMRELLTSIQNGEVDLIVGTQIVAKGHHFPNLATVGVVDGDLGLGLADPRAGERTFQVLYQVTGRAGRAAVEGRGLVQTHLPDHPAMEAIVSGDREAFLAWEMAARQSALMPPFGRLAALVISARSPSVAENHARAVTLAAPKSRSVEVLGPAPAPLAIIRGRHRYRVLVKATRETDLQAYMRAWQSVMPKAKGDLRLIVDIDPYSFL